jgi:hypothetical protein
VNACKHFQCGKLQPYRTRSQLILDQPMCRDKPHGRLPHRPEHRAPSSRLQKRRAPAERQRGAVSKDSNVCISTGRDAHRKRLRFCQLVERVVGSVSNEEPLVVSVRRKSELVRKRQRLLTRVHTRLRKHMQCTLPCLRRWATTSQQRASL